MLQTTTHVLFEWKYEGSEVALTGSFVDWAARIPLKKEGGVWRAVVPLTPGTYEYKFVIDDSDWFYDISKDHRSDGKGNVNNCITVVGGSGSSSGEEDHSATEDLVKTQLRKQITQAKQERDHIKTEVLHAEADAFRTWSLRQRTPISKILQRPDLGEGLIGYTVGVAGWIKTLRLQAKNTMAFIKLNDGTTFNDMQVIVTEKTPGFASILDHTACMSASVYVLGTIVASLGKEQKIELQTAELRLLGPSNAEEYPLPRGAHVKMENLRNFGHFRPRSQIIGAITKVRNSLAWATHLFFQGQGFLYVNTPLITGSDCEGAGELFQVTTLLKDSKDSVENIPRLPSGKVDYSKDFFHKKTFLTVSGQLNGEIYACAMGSVYTFGPTFRAENANTARHLAEFWMIEPEIAFADITENMNVAEQYVKFALNYVLKHNQMELQYLEEFEKKNMDELQKEHEALLLEQTGGKSGKKTKTEQKHSTTGDKISKQPEAQKKPPPKQPAKQKQPPAATSEKTDQSKEEDKTEKPTKSAPTTTTAGDGKQQKKKQPPIKDIRGFRLQPLRERLNHVASSDFARVTYTEAIEILQKSEEPFQNPVEWGIDLASEHERWLAEIYYRRPVIVHDYPKQIKAFYMRQNEDGRTVAAMDVLVPGVGELIGGSQREERVDVLEARMRECKLDPEGYQWYLDLRRYGSVPHSGFGLGFERLVCYATGAENIREAIPFPRYPGHADY